MKTILKISQVFALICSLFSADNNSNYLEIKIRIYTSHAQCTVNTRITSLNDHVISNEEMNIIIHF